MKMLFEIPKILKKFFFNFNDFFDFCKIQFIKSMTQTTLFS